MGGIFEDIFDDIGDFLLGGVFLLAGIVLSSIGAGAIGGRLILLGVTSILSGLVTPTGRSGFETSPRYGFARIENRTHDGGPVQIIYGKERVAPSWVNVRSKAVEGTQVLHLLGLVSEGEIESITDIRLNDTPVAEFGDDVTIYTRMGTATQEVIPGFDEIGTPGEIVTTRLSVGTQVPYAAKKATDAIVLGFHWPGGLYYRNSKGGNEAVHTGVRIERKLAGAADSAYQPVTSGVVGWRHISNGQWNIGPVLSTSSYRRSMSVPTPLKSGERQQWTLRITGVVSDRSDKLWAASVESAIEVVSEELAYPGIALLGLRITASGALEGSIPTVTCLVKGRKVLDPRTGATGWSRNPILITRDILTNTAYGAKVDAARIDDGVGGSWRTAMNDCDAFVTGLGLAPLHKAHEWDGVLDAKAPAEQWITQILMSCRTWMYQAQGQIFLACDKVGASVRTFSEEEGDGNRKNILGVEDDGGNVASSLSVGGIPSTEVWTHVRARYTSRDEDYAQRTIEVQELRIALSQAITDGPFKAGEVLQGGTPSHLWRGYVARAAADGDSYLSVILDPRYDDTEDLVGLGITGMTSSAATIAASLPTEVTPERVLEVQAWGVTRTEQVTREARHLLNLAQATPITVDFAAYIGDADLTIGDLITIISTRNGWHVGKLFRLLSVEYADDLTGRIHAREYDTAVYLDALETPKGSGTWTQPAGSVPPGARRPQAAGTDSSDAEDQQKGKPPAKQLQPSAPKPKPSKPSSFGVGTTSGAVKKITVNPFGGFWRGGWG